ncbi:MAG: N-acetylmuramoyl-L-alanine amidase-like domain-containing protein [Terrimicrobiaceae bacterium]
MRNLLFVLSVAFSMSLQAASLPESMVFVGPTKYRALIELGLAENWRALPVGERTTKVGLALVGTPYKNYTLELDDRIEAPSVNMAGMDCWTFFEISLAAARALKVSENPTPQDMLRMIELDRYRGGRCNGVFTSRLHYLEQWLYDNQSRGLVKDVTPSLPGARKLNRDMKEMSASWRSSKQLRANPALVPELARIESQLSRRGIWYVPKSKVPAAEKHLRNGDIICIVSTWPRGYTSHVGLAYRDKNGVLRFMHASKNSGEVIVDSRLSSYLNRYRTNAGIMVARPNDV